MSMSVMYWLMMLDNIRDTLTYFIAFGIAGVAIFFCIGSIEEHKGALRYAKISAILACLGVLGIMFLPNTKQMATIIVVPKVVNSEFVNETLPAEAKELYSLTKTWLTEKSKGKE